LTTNATDDVRRLLAAKADALVTRAASTLEEILDPLFVYVNARGQRFDKRTYIESFCISGRVIFKSQAFADVDVQDFGSFAVATMTVLDFFEVRGEPVSGAFRSLCVFRRAEAAWLWSAGHTAIAQG
jgi:hypothetical protein